MSQKRKTTNHARLIFLPICPYTRNGAIVLNFGMRGDVSDIITHVTFYVNRFRGFGGMTPRNLAISIAVAGGSYSSVSTVVLHCDMSLQCAQLGQV